MADCFDEAETTRVIACLKDAAMAEMKWIDAIVAGHVVARRLPETGLHLNPPPCRGEVVLTGIWRSDDDIQLLLQLFDGASQQNLARLCWNPNHQGDLHWHWYRKPDRDGPRESVRHPPSTIDHESMTWEVCVGRLNIVNAQQPMTL